MGKSVTTVQKPKKKSVSSAAQKPMKRILTAEGFNRIVIRTRKK